MRCFLWLFSHFTRKVVFDILYKLPPILGCQTLFKGDNWKNQENIIKLLSAEFALRALRVNPYGAVFEISRGQINISFKIVA